MNRCRPHFLRPAPSLLKPIPRPAAEDGGYCPYGESVASRTVPALTFVRLCGHVCIGPLVVAGCFLVLFLIFPFFFHPGSSSLCPVHRLRRALSRLPWIAYADTGRICVTEYSDNPEYRCISHAQSSGDRMKAARHRTGSSDTPSPPIPPASGSSGARTGSGWSSRPDWAAPSHS